MSSMLEKMLLAAVDRNVVSGDRSGRHHLSSLKKMRDLVIVSQSVHSAPHSAKPRRGSALSILSENRREGTWKRHDSSI